MLAFARLAAYTYIAGQTAPVGKTHGFTGVLKMKVQIGDLVRMIIPGYPHLSRSDFVEKVEEEENLAKLQKDSRWVSTDFLTVIIPAQK